MSPAEDRHRFSPNGLRDAGDDDERIDEDTPPSRRARDAGRDAGRETGTDPRVYNGASDAGSLASSSRPRDAATRADANVTPGSAAQPALIPNTPVSAPVNDPSRTLAGGQITDRALADRDAEEREAEGRDDDEPDDDDADDSEERDGDVGASQASSRPRSGAGGLGPNAREAPTPPVPGLPRGASRLPGRRPCFFGWECPASACALSEFQCCTAGACGCKSSLLGSCRAL